MMHAKSSPPASSSGGKMTNGAVVTAKSHNAAATNNNNKKKEGHHRTSLLAAYFWGVLSAFGLLSVYLAMSSAEHLPHHHQGSSHHQMLQQSKVSLKQLLKDKRAQAAAAAMAAGQQQPPPHLFHGFANKNRHDFFKQSDEPPPPAIQQQPPLQVMEMDSNGEIKEDDEDEFDEQQSSPDDKTPHHPLAGLSCADHGGPKDDAAAAEMVYWQDVPSDNQHQSPFYAPNRYLTFEPDHGGWNNIRMGMETVIALAYAMGRTLVLPPAQKMYLLNKAHDKDEKKSKPEFSFAHFFDMPSIHAEHNGFDIISTDEFLRRQIAARDNGQPTALPLPKEDSMQTNYDGPQADHWKLFLRRNAKNVIWDVTKCIAYFPESPNHDAQAMQRDYQAIMKRPNPPTFEDYIGKPTPFNATALERLVEMSAERNQLCLYSPELQEAPVLHFPNTVDADDDNSANWDPRLLVHFYAFLAFADVHQDLWMKRFVRDHVRYTDEIQCAAARVVHALRQKVQTVHGRADGRFHTMHVRRGDFQYKKTRVSAEELYRQASKVFQDGDVVFIATDQRDKTFFDEPLRQHFHLYFLDDFIADGTVGSQINPNYYGMMDQLIASRGHLFIGCWFSTFTGYINRLRGYHSQLAKEPGYERGEVRTSYYYAPPDRFQHMHTYYPVKQVFYAREFPTAWRLLNRDLPNVTTAAAAAASKR